MADIELAHRICRAWAKFHLHRRTLTNRRTSVRLRLQLFNAVVTPTALLGLATLPLTDTQLGHMDATQRRTLRRIVGMIRLSGEDWAATMSRIKDRAARAFRLQPVPMWSVARASTQWRYARRLGTAAKHSWAKRAAHWRPEDTHRLARRPVGRPRRRWDDRRQRFCEEHMGCPSGHWLVSAATTSPEFWAASELMYSTSG